MRVFFCFLIIVTFFSAPFLARADELEEIKIKLEKLKSDLELSRNATTPLEADVARLKGDLDSIKTRISAVEREVQQKEKEVKKGEEELFFQKNLLDARAKTHYINARKFSTAFVQLITDAHLSDSLHNFFYQKTLIDRDRNAIVGIAIRIKTLEEKKATLEKERVQLAFVKKKTDEQSAFLSGEITKAKKYQAELTGQIAALSSRQQAILAEKTGTFQTSVGDVPLSDDYNGSPAFNPPFSPAFALFSFGAPHFKGMSQYGAYGRAKSGQNYEDILKAYYGNVRIENVDTNINIPTTAGALSFEDTYLKGIAEMPTRWADEGGYEALKAQAVAARSYALTYTGWRMNERNSKNAICTTEACQVYNSSKASNPGRWADAVNDTKGKILVSNGTGEVVNSWYASTSGGYQDSYSSLGHSTPSFWDTASGRDGWTNQAYEKISGSPWFYKAWYKNRSGDACERSHPWLTQEEMTDVLNAWLVLSQVSDERVSPLGGCFGGNPYSMGELSNRANAFGGSFNLISSVSVDYSTNGYTATVKFSTNKGEVNISGSEFKKIFNLRAPGRISLKSGLFNIERR